MTLAEAKAYGLPCVLYDLPHLEMVRDGLGIRTVAQGDVAAAAEAIIALLEDTEERRRLGRAARQSMEAFARYDLAAGWREALEAVVSGKPAAEPATEGEETTRILLRTLVGHLQQGRAATQEAEHRRKAWTVNVTEQRDAVRQRIERLTARIEELTRQRDVRQERTNRLAERVAALTRELEAAQRERVASRTAMGKLQKQLKALGARYEKSISWRVTAPLRLLGKRSGGKGGGKT